MEDDQPRIVEFGANEDAFRAKSDDSRGPWPGRAAAVVAAASVLLEVTAIIVGNERHWTVATWLGYGVIGLTVVSFVGGLVAAILRRGGAWGVAAMILSVLTNPLVQIAVLGLFGSS